MNTYLCPLLSGNPLTCDCEILWLRNMASDERNIVQDQPICYFPQQLSGNPLRQLRTSRFTCGARSSDMIKDACRGIPVKTPVQQHIQQGLNAGKYLRLRRFYKQHHHKQQLVFCLKSKEQC